jgi:hypothetical protein
MISALRLFKANIRPLPAATILMSVALLVFILPTDFTRYVFQTLYSPAIAAAIYIPAFLIWEHQHIRELFDPLIIIRMTQKKRILYATVTSSMSAFIFSLLITVLILSRSAINNQTTFRTESKNMLFLMFFCFLSVSILFKTIYLLTHKSFLSFSVVILIVFFEYAAILFGFDFQIRILMAPSFMPISFTSSICSYLRILLLLLLLFAYSSVYKAEEIHRNEKG